LSAAASHWQLHSAVRRVKNEGVIAYPTEAVFGLGCNPGSPRAVARLLELKNRPWQKGLILLVDRLEKVQHWLQPLSTAQRQRLDRSWPGPITWLLPAADCCPDWIRGRYDTLAVRISAHPLVRELCEQLDTPLVSTSANRSGRQPARSVLGVRIRFGTRVDYVLPGTTGNRHGPTSIRDLVSGKPVRK